MASNITENSHPYIWSSANDDVVYEFGFKPYLINGIGNDSGNAQITGFANFDVTPTPGEYIYISSPLYNGTFKVLTVGAANIVTIDTPYIGIITVDTYSCYHLRVPIFSLYKGFTGLNQFSANLPLTKVLDLKPSISYNTSTGIPYIEINLKSITGKIFSIQSNTVANSIDYSMFNAIYLTWDSINSTTSYVLNSAITNEELQYKYISSLIIISMGIINFDGTYLVPTDKPFIANSGVSFCSLFQAVLIENSLIVVVVPFVQKFINGIKQ